MEKAAIMFREKIAVLSAVMILLFTTACNNDIFIEDVDLPDETTITLDGDGGEWNTSFTRKGLTHIGVDFLSEQKEYVTYYGVDGGTVGPDCPPSQLQSIVYETPVLYYSIGFSGDMIYISSSYNVSYPQSFRLRLEYDYGVSKQINVTINSGEQLPRVSGWYLSGNMHLKEDIEKATFTTRFTNNSQLAQKFEIMPLREAKCSDVVMPADQWAHMLSLSLPMLVFNGEDWELREFEDIYLGLTRNFISSQYRNEKITIEVPANTKATVTYTLYYTFATQDGILYLFNPVLEQDFEEPVKWSSIYATHYDYTVKYE